MCMYFICYIYLLNLGEKHVEYLGSPLCGGRLCVGEVIRSRASEAVGGTLDVRCQINCSYSDGTATVTDSRRVIFNLKNRKQNSVRWRKLELLINIERVSKLLSTCIVARLVFHPDNPNPPLLRSRIR